MPDAPYQRMEVIGNATLSGIYTITNTVNGKQYVGSAVNLVRRWNQHKSDLSLGRHKSLKLQAAWNKHGLGAFQFTPIEIVEHKANLLWCEQAWLDRLQTVVHGYNILPIAGSRLGVKHTQATRDKLTAKRRLRVCKPCSEATKRKISEAQIGKPKPPCSPEYRALMSVLMKGRKKPRRTVEQRAKAAAIQSGKKASAETRRTMSEAQTLRWARERVNVI